ncbi:MAG: hypothetical protein JW904_13615 [Spirochaetales bacterium]|nr:hypothetical protein [Spirochaetales bacterium]
MRIGALSLAVEGAAVDRGEQYRESACLARSLDVDGEGLVEGGEGRGIAVRIALLLIIVRSLNEQVITGFYFSENVVEEFFRDKAS